MDFVDTMASTQTEWHGKGVKVDHAMNGDEALQLAGLDWKVIQRPVEYNGVAVPDYFMNVRDDTQEVLGIVKSPNVVVIVNSLSFTVPVSESPCRPMMMSFAEFMVGWIAAVSGRGFWG